MLILIMCIVINYIIVNTLLLINNALSNKWNNSQITQKNPKNKGGVF